ncbi:MAG: RDD family protein [Betaproteobacteria bacterium]|nr:RDD family protein [Betaproteobacteria bacterium]
MTYEKPEDRHELSVRAMAEKYDGSIIVRRWLGCWVDMVGSISCFVVPDFILGNELYRETLAIWLLLAVSYFVVTEWLWGRTLGKVLTGTIVVNESGGRPNLGQVLVRTVLRLFEVNPLLAGGVPAGIAAAVSSRKQRIGDMIANTYVVRSRDVVALHAAG